MWIGLPLPSEMRANAERKLNVGVAEAGCADAGLYRRFVAAGLGHLNMGPKLGINRDGPGFSFMRTGFESGQRAGLSPDELRAWDAAVAQADADGTFMYGSPYHCAIGNRIF
jgi:ABC-type amino acid transport substrate-binding protein